VMDLGTGATIQSWGTKARTKVDFAPTGAAP
jgi:hypothetical protein